MAFALTYTRWWTPECHSVWKGQKLALYMMAIVFKSSSSDSICRDPWLSLYTKGMDRNGPSKVNWLQNSRTKVQLLFKVLFGVLFGIWRTNEHYTFYGTHIPWRWRLHLYILAEERFSLPLEPYSMAINSESDQY